MGNAPKSRAHNSKSRFPGTFLPDLGTGNGFKVHRKMNPERFWGIWVASGGWMVDFQNDKDFIINLLLLQLMHFAGEN